MLTSRRLVYVFVYVSDLVCARRFYEEGLGLVPIEKDERSVKYVAGGVVLALNIARDFGVPLEPAPDPTLLVFHVPDIDEARGHLERRGVRLDKTLRYDIGATAATYDPDGHCVTLYEPSKEAMTWPSARTYRALVGPARPRPTAERGLADAALVYVFLFVESADVAWPFYHQQLGLPDVERDEALGVVKFDAGGVLLATHPADDDMPVEAIRGARSIALVFDEPEVESVAAALRSKGVPVIQGPSRSNIGTTALLVDPYGHRFFLYAPSAEAQGWPSGRIIYPATAPGQPVQQRA